MKNISNILEAAILRQKAEAKIAKGKKRRSGSPFQLPEADTFKLLHELNVHQIELEMQNQELMAAKTAAQEALDNYTELYDFAQSGSFTLTKEGEIKELNLTGAQMLGKERQRLKNSKFGFFLAKESLPVFNAFLKNIFKSKDKETCEVTLIPKANLPLYAHLTGIATHGGKQCLITAVDLTSRKESDEALADSENRYRRLFEASQDGVLILDEETGMIKDVNPYLMKMMGYSKEQFLDKAIWEIGFFKDIAANKHKFKELQKKKFVHYEDLPLKREDGQEFHVEFVSNVYLENNKKVIQCNIRDITERKRYADSLADSETRYRRLFESANDGILILDAETGKVIDLNPIMVDLLGHSKEYFTDKAFWEIEFFKDIAADKEKYLEFKQKKNVSYEDLLTTANDGRAVNIQFLSKDYKVDKVNVIQCNIRDITQRKKEENEAIHTSRVLSVNNQINHAIINIHDKRILLEKICKIAALHGKYRMAWIGMIDEENKILKPITWAGFEDGFFNDVSKYFVDDSTKNHGPVILAIKLEKPFICNDFATDPLEITWREEALKRKYFSSATFPIKVYDKTIGAFTLFTEIPDFFDQEEVNLLTNVTANISFALESIENEKGRRQVEKELKNYRLLLEETIEKRTTDLTNANKELLFQIEEKEKQALELIKAKEIAESSDRLKSIFLATMSHELRTPLNSIIGFSGILMQEIPGALNEEQKKQLAMVQSSGRHLLSLINVVLDLSRIESGELRANNETFNIMDVIEDVMKTVGPSADSKGLSLSMIKKPKNGEIISDKQRVHQVLLNLVDNAIKFTEKGTVSIGCNRENGWLKMEVSDTGMGIKKEDLAGIFNPFTQIDNALTRKFEGSGLGLSISEKLVELLHGTIEVKSEVGVGSTFTVTLPVSLTKE